MTLAKVTTRFEGFHKYPAAPEGVEFLASLHRHIFHLTVWIQQHHDERDVEYILFKRWLESKLPGWQKLWPETYSCEAMARAIGSYVQKQYGVHRMVQVELLEDGENGALVQLTGTVPRAGGVGDSLVRH